METTLKFEVCFSSFLSLRDKEIVFDAISLPHAYSDQNVQGAIHVSSPIKQVKVSRLVEFREAHYNLNIVNSHVA